MVVEAQYLHVPLLQRVFALLAFFHEREKELSLSLARFLLFGWPSLLECETILRQCFQF